MSFLPSESITSINKVPSVYLEIVVCPYYKQLTKNKTCIIISNRISDIKECDKIIVLDHGKIVERGKHSELLKMEGEYYKFFENQANKAKISILE